MGEEFLVVHVQEYIKSTEQGVDIRKIRYTMAMLAAIIIGIGVGVMIALPTGPIGLLVMQRMLMGGLRIGFWAGMGAAVSDVFYAILLAVGLRSFLHKIVWIGGWMDIVVAIILIVIGIRALRMELAEKGVPVHLHTNSWKSFLSAALINIVNPQVILSLSAILAAVGVGRTILGVQELIVFSTALIIGSALFWYGFGRWVVWVTKKANPLSHERIQIIFAWVLIVVGGLMAILGACRILMHL